MRDEIVFIDTGWLIDGSGAAIRNNIRIGLQNGIIRSIRKRTDPMPDTAQGDASILDFSSCTLLPRLIDSHVHLALSPK